MPLESGWAAGQFWAIDVSHAWCEGVIHHCQSYHGYCFLCDVCGETQETVKFRERYKPNEKRDLCQIPSKAEEIVVET